MVSSAGAFYKFVILLSVFLFFVVFVRRWHEGCIFSCSTKHVAGFLQGKAWLPVKLATLSSN